MKNLKNPILKHWRDIHCPYDDIHNRYIMILNFNRKITRTLKINSHEPPISIFVPPFLSLFVTQNHRNSSSNNIDRPYTTI